ncbi:WecB/TagA/CpsF family glycosyltransferase [Candidatus Amesbacteria bacterium]|nr:WecB/TagA/CpsF family glycosyltransferase [Candidatus Amesbacteria bacterium]
MRSWKEKKWAKRVDILGVMVASSPMSEVLKRIRFKIQESRFNSPVFRPFFVVTVNPEFVVMSQEDEEFKRILNKADLAIPDGAGLKLAGAKYAVPGRVVVEALLKSKPRAFYLGGRDGVAKKMADKYGGKGDEGHENIKYQISNIKSNSKIIKKINQFKPDLLLVAYGAPWQEKWIYRHLPEIKAKVVMGVGGTFDYLVGKSKVPPDWVTEVGWEWLWRLVYEPWRWRRQLRLVKFVCLVAMGRFGIVDG